MKYNEAYKIANMIKKHYSNYKLHIVGSILRRKKDNIHDIDFITNIPLPEKKKFLLFYYHDIPVNIWYYDDLKIGKFLRSYPTYLLIAIRKGLKKNGYKLTNKLFYNKTEIKNFTIKKLFELADIKYRPLSHYYEF